MNARKLSDKLNIYYTRHDELIIEVDKEFFQEHGEKDVITLIRDVVEHQVDNWIPFKVDVEQVERSNINKVFEIMEDEDD
jgi:DNA polymerase I-like protein with 3'-5' exonuclease and polymerase domains